MTITVGDTNTRYIDYPLYTNKMRGTEEKTSSSFPLYENR